jgi:sterol 3beta-glucosyltransferase/vancomycin aglycone glucosyltransferase
MRIGIQTWGSEGDIRPFLALAHALSSRGHQVELVYTEIGERRYEAVADALGFRARAVASPVIADREELYAIGLKAIYARDEFQQGLLIAKRLLEPVIPAMHEAALDLAKRSDLLVHHFILHAARAAADRLGTPSVTVAFAHLLAPSRHIRPTGMPRFGEWMNAIGWKIAQVALNQTLLKDVNRFRARVGLPRFRDLMYEGWPSPLLHLIAASPAFIDRPADWPNHFQMSGFLDLPSPQHEPLSSEVEAFLSHGPAPVFMGFGSLMPSDGMHLDETIATFAAAAKLSGQRAIIQAEIERPPEKDMLFVRRTPHAKVFPRCAAVVHHAGAGTTHSTLRAGVPTIAVPHVSDQFGWSEELHRLGCAPAPLKRKKLTAAALGERIRETVGNPRIKAAAQAMQRKMQDDDGPGVAAALIERSLGHKN